MKNFLLNLLPYLTSKAAITAAVCVSATAAVTATATTVAYNHKVADYERTIDALEAEQKGDKNDPAASKMTGEGDISTAVRVVDGILEVWDGNSWTDYGSVDDILSSDPFFGGSDDEKKREVEKSVAAKKLDELGLKLNEEGQIVPKEDSEIQSGTASDKKTVILVGSTAKADKSSDQKKATASNGTGNNTKNGKSADQVTNPASAINPALTREQVMAAIQGSGSIASMPMSAASTVTTATWTAQPSSGGGSDSGGSSDSDNSNDNNDNDNDNDGDSSNSGGGGGGGSSVSNESNTNTNTGTNTEVVTDNGGGGFNEGGSDDCGDDVK